MNMNLKNVAFMDLADGEKSTKNHFETTYRFWVTKLEGVEPYTCQATTCLRRGAP